MVIEKLNILREDLLGFSLVKLWSHRGYNFAAIKCVFENPLEPTLYLTHHSAIVNFTIDNKGKWSFRNKSYMASPAVPERTLENNWVTANPDYIGYLYPFDHGMFTSDILLKINKTIGRYRHAVKIADSIEHDKYNADLTFADYDVEGNMRGSTKMLINIIMGNEKFGGPVAATNLYNYLIRRHENMLNTQIMFEDELEFTELMAQLMKRPTNKTWKLRAAYKFQRA